MYFIEIVSCKEKVVLSAYTESKIAIGLISGFDLMGASFYQKILCGSTPIKNT